MADAHIDDIFTVVNPGPEEVETLEFALSVMRNDLRDALPVLMGSHSIDYTDQIEGTHAVPRPEGLYPGGRLIQVRPLRRDGHIRRNRVAGTTIHEMGHGFRLSPHQRESFVRMFDRTGGWREGGYWDRVNEAFCYWLTRIATNGRLVSPYEARTLELADERQDDFLALILGDPGGTRDEPEPNEPEPGPDPEVTQMQQRAEAAERERSDLLEWQRAVRAVVDRPPG